jgi:hypothetical protein
VVGRKSGDDRGSNRKGKTIVFKLYWIAYWRCGGTETCKMSIVNWGNEKLWQAFECKIRKEETTWETFADKGE